MIYIQDFLGPRVLKNNNEELDFKPATDYLHLCSCYDNAFSYFVLFALVLSSFKSSISKFI